MSPATGSHVIVPLALWLCVAAGCGAPRGATIHDMQVNTTANTLDLRVQMSADRAADDVELFVTLQTAEARPKLVYAQPVRRVELDDEAQWFDLTTGPIDVEPWSPNNPKTYRVTVEALREGTTLAIGRAGVAFGSIAWRDGKLYVNGEPTFIRAVELDVSRFPAFGDDRSARAFAAAVMADLRSRGLNAVRLVNAPRRWAVAARAQGLIPIDATPGHEVVIDPTADGEPVLGYMRLIDLPADAQGVLVRPVVRLGPAADERALRLVARLAVEHTRRNYLDRDRIAGIMPVGRWYDVPAGADAFDDCRPTAALEQLTTSLQPVLISWDAWRPHLYAGGHSPAMAHLINQRPDGRGIDEVVLVCELIGPDGRVLSGGTIRLARLPHGYGGRAPVMIDVPEDAPAGEHTFRTTLGRGQTVVSAADLPVTVRTRNWARLPSLGAKAAVIDPSQATQQAMQRLGVAARPVAPFDPAVPLLINCAQWQARPQTLDAVRRYAQRGGHVLLLQPGADVLEQLGLPLRPADQPRGLMVEPVDAKHPIFRGIEPRDLVYLSDPRPGPAAAAGWPQIHPVTAGMTPAGDPADAPADVGRMDVLARYGVDGRSIALARCTLGQGAVLASGLDLVRRRGIDPIADRLLANIVAHLNPPEGER